MPRPAFINIKSLFEWFVVVLGPILSFLVRSTYYNHAFSASWCARAQRRVISECSVVVYGSRIITTSSWTLMKQTQVIGSSNRIEGCDVVVDCCLINTVEGAVSYASRFVQDTFILTKSLYYCTNFCTLVELMNILNMKFDGVCLSFRQWKYHRFDFSMLTWDVGKIQTLGCLPLPFFFVCLSPYFSELPGNPENNEIGR